MFKIVVVMLLAAASLAAGTASAQATGNTLARIKTAKAINVAYSPRLVPFSAANAGADPSRLLDRPVQARDYADHPRRR